MNLPFRLAGRDNFGYGSVLIKDAHDVIVCSVHERMEAEKLADEIVMAVNNSQLIADVLTRIVEIIEKQIAVAVQSAELLERVKSYTKGRT